MRVLLTGSTGWLGRFLAPRLRQDGHEVIGLDIAPGPETRIVGSIADADCVARAFAEHAVQAVVHAAALHKPDIARFAPSRFIDVNVVGTLNLLQAAARHACDRFVMTSTTSVMISQALRDGAYDEAVWLDERSGPLEPRNIYGVSKLAAEGLCWVHHRESGMACVVLRTSRFFAEDDDPPGPLSGPNLKANELLFRRLTVEDAVEAHARAFERAPGIGFGLFVVSAPPPFRREDAAELRRDPAGLVRRLFPEAEELYRARGWRLPDSIDRVYDPTLAQSVLGFRCRTDFAAMLRALREGRESPVRYDPGFVSLSTLAAGW